jgi:hypothetical protein
MMTLGHLKSHEQTQREEELLLTFSALNFSIKSVAGRGAPLVSRDDGAAARV